MKRNRRLAVALTIAGSDSGGGAGIQADLKTFASLGVHGTTAVTCITAQNPKAVLGIHPCPPEIVRKQIDAVFAELPPDAVKTGMLFSAGIIRLIARCFRHRRRPALVVDPVMVSTSGALLLQAAAIKLLKNNLLPLATVVTPNVPEAEVLLGRRLKSVEDLRLASREIHERFGCAALVKGGHLPAGSEAVDIFFDGKTELLLSAPFVKKAGTHGTGCTYSAAITAFLAQGRSLETAVAAAKEHITGAIVRRQNIGRHTTLNNWWR